MFCSKELTPMIVYPDVPVKRQRDLTNIVYKNSLLRKQPPAIRVDVFHQVYWQWVKCKEWHGSMLMRSLLLNCRGRPDLHAFLWKSWDWELVLLSAETHDIFTFSDSDHSEIWPHPGQVWHNNCYSEPIGRCEIEQYHTSHLSQHHYWQFCSQA